MWISLQEKTKKYYANIEIWRILGYVNQYIFLWHLLA